MPGHRVLTASFSIHGMSSQGTTAFDYGTSLPDLAPGQPSIEPAPWTFYVPTRTLSLIVSNQGASTAAGTQAAIYDESSGGDLIGAAVVPSLEPGQQAVVEIVWDVAGQGGDHLLKVVVDPVDEFDTMNNTSKGVVTLPRLASSLSIGSSSIAAGDSFAMQVVLENLQSDATLPVTATLRIGAPTSGTVFTETWSLTLIDGEQRFLDTVWDLPADADIGLYFIEAEITSVYGDYHLHRSFFAVQEQFEAGFSAVPTSGPAPLSVTFTNQSSGVYDTCLWIFGDGSTSADCEDPAYIYSIPGVYTVSLNIEGTGGSDWITRTNYITVHQTASSVFSASPTSGPDPLRVAFTNESTGDFDACLWVFGDGGESTDCLDPSRDYLNPGVYSVTLKVSGLGSMDTLTKSNYITVYQHVEADFIGFPSTGQVPLVVEFTNLSTGDFDTCAWTFGDGEVSDVCGNPIHIYDEPGEYTVKLTVAGRGGTDSRTIAGYISAGDYQVFLPLLVRR